MKANFTPTTTTPLKRHPALVHLSREHHYGLLLCWKIRQGLAQGVSPKRVSCYVQYFMTEFLLPHFREEEHHIFPLLQAEHPLRVAAESQHREIHSLDNGLIINNRSLPERLEAFCGKLEHHIRFEERELFAAIQESVDEATLVEMVRCHGKRPLPNDHTWSDRFWEKKNGGCH